LTLTIHAERAPAYGKVEDNIRLETRAGSAEIPVRAIVLKPRPAFRQVAFWFVPLFAFALAPATITATLGSAHQYLLPPAATSSLALGLMLLIIAVAADLGIAERLACGVLAACMCFVLGAEAAGPNGIGYNSHLGTGPQVAAATAIGFALLLMAQILTSRRWKFWGVVLASLGTLLGGVCFRLAGS
jgi:hypothetical protein